MTAPAPIPGAGAFVVREATLIGGLAGLTGVGIAGTTTDPEP